jgi:S-adenosyl methyltransferase
VTAEFDPATPNMAGIYDYWLGGKDNYPADRAEAQRLLTIYPPLRDLGSPRSWTGSGWTGRTPRCPR